LFNRAETVAKGFSFGGVEGNPELMFNRAETVAKKVFNVFSFNPKS